MNIEKLYQAVEDDDMNSPLVTVCYELEQQGYNVILEGVEVTSTDLEDTMFQDLERSTNEFNFALVKDNTREQKFKLVFTDFHKFNIQQAV